MTWMITRGAKPIVKTTCESRRQRRALASLMLVFPLLAGEARPARASEEKAAEASVRDAVWSPPQLLRIGDAFRRALAAHPQAERAREDVAVADADRRLRLSWILPRIAASGNLTENSEEVSFGSGADLRTILPKTDWSYRVTLQQPIYAGNRERKAYEQAKLDITSAQARVGAVEQRVLLQVAADYFAVIEADALIEIERLGHDLAVSRKKQAQDLFDAGETTRVELLHAETAIKAADRRVAEAERLRETVAGRLRLDLADDSPVRPLALEEPDLALPPLPDSEELVRLAAERRADVRVGADQEASAKLEVEKQKGTALPVITADAAWIRQKSTFPLDSYSQGSIRMTVPIFQSGELGARVSGAEARLRQASFALAEARRSVREDVRRALVDFESARKLTALAEDQLAAAVAEYDQVSALYKVHETTALDAEASENALLSARRAVVTSRLDRKLAELAVWHAVGALDTALAQEISK